MSNGGAAAGAAAAAATARAIKASGAIVRIEASEFVRLLERAEKPLVVSADAFWGGTKYLLSYRGLVFYTKTEAPLDLPGETELVIANRIWIPS
ncbi:MAG: hypothetical protein ACE5GX_19730 [Thermoanaerobaculia bacterium]